MTTDLQMFMTHPDDQEDPVMRQYVIYRNAMISSLADLAKTLDDDEAYGTDPAQAADNFVKRLESHSAHPDVDTFVDFAHAFNRCLAAGPGCDHEEEDHAAMVRVFTKKLLP